LITIEIDAVRLPDAMIDAGLLREWDAEDWRVITALRWWLVVVRLC
jgi:hypothetical protein